MLATRGRHAAPGTVRRWASLLVAGVTATASVLTAGAPAGATSSGSGGGTVQDYNQCANGTNHSTACDQGWINGIVNGNNSSYREGEVVPQRALFTLDKTTSTFSHTIRLRYDTLKGNVHAFDSLATWNATETTAVRCQGLAASACPGGNASSFPIPDDPKQLGPLGSGSNGSTVTTTHMLPAGPQRQIVLYGGTITDVSVPSHFTVGSNDASADVVVTFTAPASASSQQLLLLYGGHLANSLDWGQGEGASSINGGPYHNSLIELDGAKIGNRDNQVMNAAGPVPPASLAVTKTPDAATVNAGDQIGFTIKVTSSGGSTAKAVTLDDPLPTGSGITWKLDPTGDASSCSVASNKLTCSFGDLGIGASKTVHLSSTTTYDSPGTITNTATACSPNAGTAKGTGTITVNKPGVTFTKKANASPVTAGQTIGFTITTGNSGPGTANGLTIRDTLPIGTGLSWSLVSGTGCVINGTAPAQQYLVCDLASLAPGATWVVKISSTTTDQSPTTITNKAYLCIRNAPGKESQDTITLTEPQPSMTFAKTAVASPVDAGKSIGFVLTIGNGGPGKLYATKINDPLPSATGVSWSIASQTSDKCSISGSAPQVLSCDLGTMAAGASYTVTITSGTTAATAGTLKNTATATSSNGGTLVREATIVVNQPGITLSKTPDNGVVNAGDFAVWTVTVKNTGSGTASGVYLSDPLPDLGGGATWAFDGSAGPCVITVAQQVQCTIGDLAPGATVSVRLKGKTSSASGTSLYNKATVSGSNFGTLSKESTIKVLQPKLAIVKTASAATVNSGDPISFTVTLSNATEGTIHGAKISDPLPAGLTWSIDGQTGTACSIGSGALTCNVGDLTTSTPYTVKISTTTLPSTTGDVINTAYGTSDNAGSAQSTAKVTVQQPKLTLTKVADKASVDVLGSIGYVITLTNAGPGTAYNVSLTDVLPSGSGIAWSMSPDVTGCTPKGSNIMTLSCSRATLLPNSSLVVHVVSSTTLMSCGDYKNTATVTAGNVTSQLTSAATITVVCKPVLELVKSSTCGQTTVPPGGLMSYTLAYRNTGTATATNVVLTDTPDATTQVVAAPGATVTHAPERATWTFATLSVGSTFQTKTIVVRVGSSNGSILNKASLAATDATTATSQLGTVVSDAGALSKGYAYALDLKGLPVLLMGLDLNIDRFGLVSSTNPGTPNEAATTALTLPITSPVAANVLAQTSRSKLEDATASTQSSSEVANVNLLGGLVTASAIKAVSNSSATALTAGSNAIGSTVAGLALNGTPVVNVIPGSTLYVNEPLTTNPILKVEVLKQTAPNAGLSAGKWATSHEVTGLTITVLKASTLLPGLTPGVVIKVADAQSQATYPSGLVCGSTPASVEGEAFTVSAEGTLSGTSLALAKQGDVLLPATGGDAGNTVAGAAVGTTLTTSSGTTHTAGYITPAPHATSNAHVENLSLLGGAVTAGVLDVTATSDADGANASTTFVTTLAQLKVGTLTVDPMIPPNTVIALPQPGGEVLYVVINERTEAGNGTTDTTGTVNALHIYVLKGATLTAEVIVASAHSGAHSDHL